MKLVFKHDDDEMELDEERFVQDYLQWCKEENIVHRKNVEHMKTFVEEYYSGLDDCYYYCDNSDEIEEKMLSILTSANIKNNILQGILCRGNFGVYIKEGVPKL